MKNLFTERGQSSSSFQLSDHMTSPNLSTLQCLGVVYGQKQLYWCNIQTSEESGVRWQFLGQIMIFMRRFSKI